VVDGCRATLHGQWVQLPVRRFLLVFFYSNNRHKTPRFDKGTWDRQRDRRTDGSIA